MHAKSGIHYLNRRTFDWQLSITIDNTTCDCYELFLPAGTRSAEEQKQQPNAPKLLLAFHFSPYRHESLFVLNIVPSNW